jgi:hypothetical protein
MTGANPIGPGRYVAQPQNHRRHPLWIRKAFPVTNARARSLPRAKQCRLVPGTVRTSIKSATNPVWMAGVSFMQFQGKYHVTREELALPTQGTTFLQLVPDGRSSNRPGEGEPAHAWLILAPFLAHRAAGRRTTIPNPPTEALAQIDHWRRCAAWERQQGPVASAIPLNRHGDHYS